MKPLYPLGVCSRDAAIAFVEGNPKDRRTLPQLVFLDRQGQVVAKYKGSSDFLQYDQDREQNIRAKLAELLSRDRK